MTDSIDKKSNEKRDNLEVDLDVESDEAESFVLLKNEFQDDDDAIDRLLMNSDFDADDEPGQSDVDEVGALNESTDFSDFSDFSNLNEPEMVRQDSPPTAAAEVDDFFGLGDDFGVSKLTQDEEVEATSTTVADLISPNEEQQIVIEEFDVDEDAGASEQLDDFSDFSDFNEPQIIPAVETEESEQAAENLSAHVDAADLADEADDFTGLRDDFDESDMIQDDKVDTSADLVEQSFDDEAAIISLFPDAGFDFEDALENAGGKEAQLLDDFDESDMIQDEVDDWANLVAPGKEPQTVDEEPVNDLQDIARDGVYAASQSGTGAADENNFDSLLLDADFDSEDPLAQLVGKKDDFSNDVDLIETDDFFQLDEVSDDFSRQTDEVQLAETEILSTQDDDFLLPDFDITADTEICDVDSEEDPFGDVDFLNEEEAVIVFGSEAEEPKFGGNEAVVEPAPKHDSAINTDINAIEALKKQLVDAENKVKKTKLLSYAAVGFGAIALLAAIGLGVMTFSAKTEVSKLTEAVSTFEASLAKSAANNPNEEIDAMRNSVVQLNQQVDGFITELKENPLFSVDLLNNKVPDLVAKQEMVSKSLDMLQVKMGGLEGQASSNISVAESPKVEVVHEHAQTQEDKVHEIAPVKIEAAHEPVKEGVAHEHAPSKKVLVPEHVPTLEKAGHEKAPVKVEVVPETAPVKVKTQLKMVVVKPIVPPKAVPKQEPVKVKIQAAPGKWGINLVAFKQEWYAKSKVAEFAQQGVVAEVIPVHEKNTTLYRLRVGGFKSKAEADSNKARIKRALNLDSVWVSDN